MTSNVNWSLLSGELAGFVALPGDSAYTASLQIDNGRIQLHPAAVVFPFVETDVARAMKFARDHKIPMTAKGGGHSAAGYCLNRGGMVIDLQYMNAIAFNRADETVRVQLGARWREVYVFMEATGTGLFPVGGGCPTVGVPGFMLGGGYSFVSRSYGMSIDNLHSIKLVTPDGRLRHVGIHSTSQADKDLFWACCGGGGGNFGINTSFTMKTIAADRVTVFQLVWQGASVALGEALMQSLHAAPDTLGSRVSFRANQGRVDIDLLGQLRGSRAEVLEILAPALRLARPYEMKIEADVDYWDGQDFLHEDPLPTYYQERSAYIPDQFPAQFLAQGFEHLRRAPSTGGTRDLRFFQTGGKINTVADDATAFVHRSNHWLMVVGLYWDAATNANEPLLRSAHDWQNQFYQAMLPATDRMAYQNFPDPSLTDWRAAYYGKNFKKLHDIKTAVDPAQVFNFAQAI